MARFRHAFRKLAPRWLTEGEGERVLYSLNLVIDAFAERTRQSVLARFPGHAPPDALGPMSRDRGLIRGFAEPAAALRLRLLGWLDVWRSAGNAKTLMDQVAAYLYPHEVTLRLVTNNGLLWYTRATDGTFSYHFRSSSNWNWDDTPASWSRFWLIIYPPATGLWSDMTWGDLSYWGELDTWGSDNTLAQVEAIRSICRRFKPAGTRCSHIVIAFDPNWFSPDDVLSNPNMPDGSWGTYWDDTSDPVASSRYGSSRYWSGT